MRADVRPSVPPNRREPPRDGGPVARWPAVRTHAQVAEILGMTKQGVQQAEQRAFAKLAPLLRDEW